MCSVEYINSYRFNRGLCWRRYYKCYLLILAWLMTPMPDIKGFGVHLLFSIVEINLYPEVDGSSTLV